MTHYFIKTFKVVDGSVFSMSKVELAKHLPQNWEALGKAEPVFSFYPGKVVVTIEVFARNGR